MQDICIAGTSETLENYTPWNNENWQIWGLNNQYWRYHDRQSLHFELHANQFYKKIKRYKGYYEWLRYNDYKVVLQAPDDKLPLAAVVRRPPKEMYPWDIRSSVQWMLMLAVCKQPKKILITGIDLCQKAEYLQQRDGVYHIMELAIEQGIEIILPNKSCLFRDESGYKVERMDNKYNKVIQVPKYVLRNTGYTYGSITPT